MTEQTTAPKPKVTATTEVLDAGFTTDAAMPKIQAAVAGLENPNQKSSNTGDALNPARPLIIRSYNDEAGNKLASTVFEVPTLDEFIADPDGRAWLESIVFNRADKKVSMGLMHWVKNGCKEVATLPTTIADFIATARSSAGSGKKRFATIAWNEHADAALASLKKFFKSSTGKELTMTKKEFELCLSDASYAESKFAALEQADWFVKILDILIAKPPVTIIDKRTEKERTDDGAIFTDWKENRDNTVADDDIELGELTF